MNVDAAMQSFSRHIIRYRWVWLALIFLVTAALANATKCLVVNNDYDMWLPANDKVSELYRLVDKQFSSTAVLFTVLDFSKKGVFQPDSLALVQRMTDALEGIDELFNVSSLTNIVDIRKADFGVEVGDLIPEIPESREELDALKKYVLSKEMYVNSLISSDAAYTVLIANIDGSSDEIVTAKKVLETIDEVADGHPYYFGGDPALLLYADHYMKKDLTFLVPFVLVVMVVILAFSFRTFFEDHKDFRKRADGVLWTLWAEKPVFFTSQIASVPEIGSAAIATAPLRVEPTGFPDLVRRFDDLLYISQIQSLGLASLVVLVLVSLTQRSLRRGAISLLSVLVPLGYILGFMGWSQIPLDFGTVLFGALIVGLGVDGSIHFMHHNHDLQIRGIQGEEAIRRSMRHVGKAIVTANATTCCGFLVLLFSNSSVLRNFGLVNSIAIFLTTISLITFLPALVTVFQVDNGKGEGAGIGGQGSGNGR